MGKRRKRFENHKAAIEFATNVNGQFNDLRQIEGAKSRYSVTYEVTDKTRKHGQWK